MLNAGIVVRVLDRKAISAGAGECRLMALNVICRNATIPSLSRPGQLPSRAARQLPDQSTIIRVEPSSTDDSRLQGALPIPDVSPGRLRASLKANR